MIISAIKWDPRAYIIKALVILIVMKIKVIIYTDNDENIPEYHTYKVTLEFSEDGKSIAYNSVENGFYLHDYGTYTVNLTLTLFKETETSEDKDTIETPTPPEIISPELVPEDIE